MKAPQFYIVTAAGFICLSLSVALVALGQSNRALEAEAKEQQALLNQGASDRQAIQNMVRELAEASPKSDAIKQLLGRHGYTVSPAPAAKE